jgi:glutaconate CoA-transferase, subunit B
VTELTTTEFLAVRVARRLTDGSLGFLGVSSGVHLLAFKVAQQTTCPNLGYVERGGRYTPGRVTITGQERSAPPPIFETDMTAMIDLVDWRQSFFDVAMLGGIQIDQYGNTNMIAVGPYERPMFRGPGTIGAAALAGLVHATHLVAERHDSRSLVDTVDYCSGMGHRFAGRTRAELGLTTVGPVALHTPLASFVFEDGVARLSELVGELTLEQVQQVTGFKVTASPSGVSAAAPPTPEEIDAVRRVRPVAPEGGTS